MKRTYPLSLDLYQSTQVAPLSLKQNDSTVLSLTLLERGKPFDLQGCRPILYVKKSDLTLVIQTDGISITDAASGVLEIELDDQCTACAGCARFELFLVKEQESISSYVFDILFLPNLEGQEPSESAVDFLPQLNQAVLEGRELRDDLTDLIGQGQTTQGQLQTAAENAQKAADRANQAAESAESLGDEAIQIANQAKTLAQQAKTTADSSAEDSSTALSTAQDAQDTANSIASEASSAQQTAQSALNIVESLQSNLANHLALQSELGSADLDSITTMGIYPQGYSSNATAERHYPDTSAGFLQVLSNGSKVYQIYYTQNTSKIFWRHLYLAAWEPWSQIYPSITHQAAKKTSVCTQGHSLTGMLSCTVSQYPDGYMSIDGICTWNNMNFNQLHTDGRRIPLQNSISIVFPKTFTEIPSVTVQQMGSDSYVSPLWIPISVEKDRVSGYPSIWDGGKDIVAPEVLFHVSAFGKYQA
ncbi:BppU family phage baseplate upper protein [[Clostridium] leptum]|nr:BppU family phage baseplate upper protein [[Clostridium] leptum]